MQCRRAAAGAGRLPYTYNSRMGQRACHGTEAVFLQSATRLGDIMRVSRHERLDKDLGHVANDLD